MQHTFKEINELSSNTLDIICLVSLYSMHASSGATSPTVEPHSFEAYVCTSCRKRTLFSCIITLFYANSCSRHPLHINFEVGKSKCFIFVDSALVASVLYINRQIGWYQSILFLPARCCVLLFSHLEQFAFKFAHEYSSAVARHVKKIYSLTALPRAIERQMCEYAQEVQLYPFLKYFRHQMAFHICARYEIFFQQSLNGFAFFAYTSIKDDAKYMQQINSQFHC